MTALTPGNISAGTANINISGNAATATASGTATNAATATALQTARTINGVSFNGTADIVVTAAAETLTGGQVDVARGGTGADLSGTGGASHVVQQASAGADFTVGQLALSDIAGAGVTESAYGAGTAYAFTNTAAAIDFGTTDPAIVIGEAGTYLLFGQVLLAYNGATVTTETARVTIRRTNNTPADIGEAVVVDLPVSTLLTNSYGVVALPPVVYTTAVATDALTLFGSVSAGLGAGTINATAVGTSLVALRIT